MKFAALVLVFMTLGCTPEADFSYSPPKCFATNGLGVPHIEIAPSHCGIGP
jgi:hypothetical protein